MNLQPNIALFLDLYNNRINDMSRDYKELLESLIPVVELIKAFVDNKTTKAVIKTPPSGGLTDSNFLIDARVISAIIEENNQYLDWVLDKINKHLAI